MRQRSSYPKPFKAQVVQECLQPGATISSVAIHHGINANVIRKWLPISQGHTQAPGLYHAEAMALSRLANDCSGVTAFVTLEPCSFHGRTPSCARALIHSGVDKVFVGLLDPDPRNSGAGIRMLRDAGITVVVGLLAEEAAEDLAGFLVSDTGESSDRDDQ